MLTGIPAFASQWCFRVAVGAGRGSAARQCHLGVPWVGREAARCSLASPWRGALSPYAQIKKISVYLCVHQYHNDLLTVISLYMCIACMLTL